MIDWKTKLIENHFPDEFAILGEDGVRGLIENNQPLAAPEYGSNMPVIEVAAMIGGIIALVDNIFSLLEHGRRYYTRKQLAAELATEVRQKLNVPEAVGDELLKDICNYVLENDHLRR